MKRYQTSVSMAAAALTLATACVPASAASAWADWIRVDGFGTIGMYQADDPVERARAAGLGT